MIRVITAIIMFMIVIDGSAQQRLKLIPFGDMESWLVREISESFVIGGKSKSIYELAEKDTIRENKPYVPKKSPWATSSVYAKVNGVHKASITVFPEIRKSGDLCALLETKMETVKVLGVINISVLAPGTMFLGSIPEPIRDTKDPQSKLMTGIPFSDKIQGVQFDYKVDPKKERIYVPGFAKRRNVEGDNAAEVCMLLQYRWEDEEGNIYAKRVATAWERFSAVQNEWKNGYQVLLKYGDITNDPSFKPFKGLITDENQIYSKNSKGEAKPVQEVGWAAPTDKVTHLVLRFSSSFGGAYVGAEGAKFWLDNINLIY